MASTLCKFTCCRSQSVKLVAVSRLALLQIQARRALTSSRNLSNGGSPTSAEEKAPLKRGFMPVGKHDGQIPERHRDAEKEPLAPFPDDVNPETGEKGGPRGPEPTRYGDWERKGRCIDF